MALELKYALLCDHATIGANGKPIAVHIFEHFFRDEESLKQPLAPFFILARIECSIADGTQHALALDLENEDNEVIAPLRFPPMHFLAQGPGLPFVAGLTLQIGGLMLPSYGGYEFVFKSGGQRLGSVRFRVVQPPTRPTET